MNPARSPLVAASAAVTERVRERLRAEQTDPTRDPDAAARIVHSEVRRHNDFALARGDRKSVV